jgi:hypothetical protein
MLGPAKINLLRAAPHRSACATNCNEIQQQHPGKRCGSRERSTSGGRIEKTLSLNFNANQGQPSKRFDNALQGEVWLVNELAGHKNAVILSLSCYIISRRAARMGSAGSIGRMRVGTGRVRWATAGIELGGHRRCFHSKGPLSATKTMGQVGYEIGTV